MMVKSTDAETVSGPHEESFAGRVRVNQGLLAAALKPTYDFIVCGAGSSGSVVARRLAENPAVTVLLLEAGGHDCAPAVTEAGQWPANLGSERDWAFRAAPNPRLNGRAIPLAMGKVLGGGSSINVMCWARGHKNDWNHFADEASDPGWGYDAVLDIYRRIEDWHGAAVDPAHRGTGGLVFVQQAPDPSPLAPATLDAARSLGIPTFENQNGRMMEGPGGAAIEDIRSRNGKRESVFRSYTYPIMDQTNLTVLTDALVTRVVIDGCRATGVEVSHHGATRTIKADSEVVLSMGSIHTPKVLMQSGVGDECELRRAGIPVRQHLPGVGRNLQDHVALYCVWEHRVPLQPRNTLSEAVVYWTTSDSDTPDVYICQAEVPIGTEETIARFGMPGSGWTLAAGVAHPNSRGSVRLTGPNAGDPLHIDSNTFGDPADFKAALAAVELCREIGNSDPLRPFARREVMPGKLSGQELERFVRDAATSYWHMCGTAKMGRDSDSVVDASLRVYGIENLRVADASIMPRITTGNTMAPCVIIGERAAQQLIADHVA